MKTMQFSDIMKSKSPEWKKQLKIHMQWVDALELLNPFDRLFAYDLALTSLDIGDNQFSHSRSFSFNIKDPDVFVLSSLRNFQTKTFTTKFGKTRIINPIMLINEVGSSYDVSDEKRLYPKEISFSAYFPLFLYAPALYDDLTFNRVRARVYFMAQIQLLEATIIKEQNATINF